MSAKFGIIVVSIIVFLHNLENVNTQTTTRTTRTRTTTLADYSYLGYSLGLGLGLTLFMLTLTIGLVVGCYCLQRKANMQRATINPNWQDPTVQAQFAGKFPTTKYPPGYPTSSYPTTTTTTTSLYPSLDPPPKYDAFENQSATTNTGNNQMPALPATINMQKY